MAVRDLAKPDGHRHAEKEHRRPPALGSATLPACAGVGSAFVDALTFGYTAARFGRPPSNDERLRTYVREFRRAELASRVNGQS